MVRYRGQRFEITDEVLHWETQSEDPGASARSRPAARGRWGPRAAASSVLAIAVAAVAVVVLQAGGETAGERPQLAAREPRDRPRSGRVTVVGGDGSLDGRATVGSDRSERSRRERVTESGDRSERPRSGRARGGGLRRARRARRRPERPRAQPVARPPRAMPPPPRPAPRPATALAPAPKPAASHPDEFGFEQ